MSAQHIVLVLVACLFLLALPDTQAQLTSADVPTPSATQRPTPPAGFPDESGDEPPSGTSMGSTASSTVSGAVVATQSPVTLVESAVVSAQISVNSSVPAQFFLAAPFKNSTGTLYVTATLCNGPGVPSYDVDNSTLLQELGMGWWAARTSTLPRLYLSTDAANKVPGPGATQGDPDLEYFFGGQATIADTTKQRDGAWITVWPPMNTRNVTGEWDFLVAASSEGAPLLLEDRQGLHFDDSDNTRALITTYNSSQGTSDNLTLAILPTFGAAALSDLPFFNSSVCAIAQAFRMFNRTGGRDGDPPLYNRTLTNRGQNFPGANGTRVQWEVSDLQPGTNYTAWLIDSTPLGSSGASSTVVWPAIKFVTKQTSSCRLVYDVDFCPSVAYSIPVGRDVSTQHALNVINQTIFPNFANFSSTIGSFPCGSEEFGEYSPVQTCDTCKTAYRDWLCAVAMPRCADPLPTVSGNTTAASYDVLDLTGSSTGINEATLPYILNRQNNSRQSYIDSEDGLDARSYGEVLPCIYTCYFVARSCPQPLIEWACPQWDITAQGSYGTFADAGTEGIGGGKNGGAGSTNERWGGPTRYIAQDAFGHLYCNAMGVDRILIATNTGAKTATGMLPLTLTVLTSFTVAAVLPFAL